MPTRFPYADAITYFARALGAAHTGALDDARASIGVLDGLSKQLASANETYWAEQVAIQRDGAAAFLALAEGKREDALRLMQDARCRHLPICEQGKVVGIVSWGDFRGLEHDRLDEETGLWERIA